MTSPTAIPQRCRPLSDCLSPGPPSAMLVRAYFYLALEPVADLGQAQRLTVHGGAQPVLPEQRRIVRVGLQCAQLLCKLRQRLPIGERAFIHQRLAVAFGDRGNIDIVVFRMILHSPEAAATVFE